MRKTGAVRGGATLGAFPASLGSRVSFDVIKVVLALNSNLT